MQFLCPLAVVWVTLVGCAGSHPVRRSPTAAGEVFKSHVAWLTAPARAGRGTGQPGGRAAANYVAAQFAAAGLEVVRQPVEDDSENVLGILRRGPEAVIVAAHYDHLGQHDGVVHPGADDNASGVAALLWLATHSAGLESRHTLIFASFGAEEAGLVGSGSYVSDPVWPLEKTRAVVNFDMIGRRFHEAGVHRDAAVGVVGLEGDLGAEQALRSAAQQLGVSVIAVPARIIELFGLHDRTDDWWFRRQGIPTVHFSTGMHDDYHAPSDTADKLSYPQIERVARLTLLLLRYLANSDRPETP